VRHIGHTRARQRAWAQKNWAQKNKVAPFLLLAGDAID
jgi:hypothetical protein